MPRPKKAVTDEQEPDAKYTAWILAAIAKVKGQKQRPNEDRIIHVLESTYGVDAQTVVEQLDLCVKAGCIIRGEFKGQSSYKDPSVTTPGSKRSPQMPSDLRKYVQKAILNEGEDGASISTIEKFFKENYPEKTEAMNDLTMAIKHAVRRGINSGRFVKEGRYVKISEKGVREMRHASSQKEVLKEKLRPKKPVAAPIAVCGFCLGTAEKNRDGEPEELISCADCGNSGHPSCLNYSPELTEKIQSERWQCIECKVCSVCNAAGNADNLLFCDACDKGFHMECLEPPMSEMPSGSWICFMCNKPSPRKRKTITTPPRRKIQPVEGLFATPLSSSSRRKLNSSLLNKCTPDSIGKRRSGKFSKHSQKSPTQKRPPLPPGVTEEDYALFKKAQELANNELSAQPAVVQAPHSRSPPFIQFGPYEITTWYSSPYPQEYARLPKLYLCEFCLKYMKSMTILQRHKSKCGWFHPPANEIYRHEDISVFEVDGAVNKIYCQNLCLLAKLFLDHKTLYYDVEPFLFYVLTLNDRKGCHLVGYFSKEKACQQKYNLSCIMTMPHYQRKGYGRLLIDFSYLLSRIEGQSGSPEKPLSDLGLLTYRSYWKSVILEYFGKHKDSQVTIRDMSRSTGMDPHDVAATLQQLNMVQRKDGNVVICLNRKNINEHMEKYVSMKRLELDPERLRWTPLVHAAVPTVVTEEKVDQMEVDKKEDGKKQKEVEQNGDVDVVDDIEAEKSEKDSSDVKQAPDEIEEEDGVKEVEEEEPEENGGITSEDEDEIVPPKKRPRKAIDESESEADVEDEEKEEMEDDSKADDPKDTPEKIDAEPDEAEDETKSPADDDVEEHSAEERRSRSSSTSGQSNDDSDDDDSSSDDSDDSSSSSSESSSSDSSSSSDDEAPTEEKSTFPAAFGGTKPTKDPVLTGVKDPPGELTIQQGKVGDEPSGVFTLPQQEGGFDLEDTPSLQDFLGGDINMSASDDLSAESLLSDVAGNFYDQSKEEKASRDKENDDDSLDMSADLAR